LKQWSKTMVDTKQAKVTPTVWELINQEENLRSPALTFGQSGKVRGKPLLGPFAGCYSSIVQTGGTFGKVVIQKNYYKIIYKIKDKEPIVLGVKHLGQYINREELNLHELARKMIRLHLLDAPSSIQ
jgi:hypothetical protein